MAMRYLGSIVNVVGSALGLVALIICLIVDVGWIVIPAVVVAYAVGALVTWLITRGRSEPDRPAAKPRRAAPG
jgi:O-antigen/teichoic acid export membrane protein